MSSRRHAPATLRNRDAIAQRLDAWLPRSGLVLEIASGTGEHAVFFAQRHAALHWQPSDPDPGALESIAAWRDEGGPGNLLPPVRLDAAHGDWPVAAADAILCINMLHISPWDATLGLFAGAAERLATGAPLIIYGAFREADVRAAPSNEEFDADLRRRNPAWGLRDLADVQRAAHSAGFDLADRVAMPANNLMLRFVRQDGAAA